MIHILANYDKPREVQGFVGKLFENIHRVDFGGDETRNFTFEGIISREGETMRLKQPINIKSEGVDKWMKKLEETMKESLKRAIKDGLGSYIKNDRETWYLTQPAQVTAVLTQYVWTLHTENFFISLENEDDEGDEL